MNDFWRGILKYIATSSIIFTVAIIIYTALQLISPAVKVCAAVASTPTPVSSISGLTASVYSTTAPIPVISSLLTDGKNALADAAWIPGTASIKTYDNYCTITKSSQAFSFSRIAISFGGNKDAAMCYPYGYPDYDGTPVRVFDANSDDYKFMIGAGGFKNSSQVFYPRAWFPRYFKVKVTYGNGTSEILSVTPRLDMVVDPLHPFISSDPEKFSVSIDTDEKDLKNNKPVSSSAQSTTISYYRIVLTMNNPFNDVKSIQLYDMREGAPNGDRNIKMNEIQLYDKYNDVKNVNVLTRNPVVGSPIDFSFDITTVSNQTANVTLFYRENGTNDSYSTVTSNFVPQPFWYQNVILTIPTGFTDDLEYYLVITQNGQELYQSSPKTIDVRVPVTSMSAPDSMTLDRGGIDTLNVNVQPLNANRKDVRFTVVKGLTDETVVDSGYITAPATVNISSKEGVASARISANSNTGIAYLKIEAGDSSYPSEYFKKIIPINVVPVRVKDIDFQQSLSLTNINDAEGNSRTLQVHYEPDNAEISSIEWNVLSSSPNGIISLDPPNPLPADKAISVMVKTNKIGPDWGTAGTATVRMKLTDASGNVFTKDCLINVSSSIIPLVNISKINIPDFVEVDNEFEVAVQISPVDATFSRLNFSSSNTNFIIEKNNTQSIDESGIIHKRFKVIGGSGTVSLNIASEKYPAIQFSQDINVTVPVKGILVTDSSSSKKLVDGDNVNTMELKKGVTSFITACALPNDVNAFKVAENMELEFVPEDDNITILDKAKNPDNSYTVGIKANHTGTSFLRITTSNPLVVERIKINIFNTAESLVLDESQISLTSSSNTKQLTATLLPADSSAELIGWKSSNPDVAQVSLTGMVTALKPGVAYVTALTANGLEATCLVNSNLPSVFEAEKAEMYKQTISARQGASGASVVDMKVDGYINFKMFAPQKGEYDLELFYGNGSVYTDLSNVTVSVNGSSANTVKVNDELTNVITFAVASGTEITKKDHVKLLLDQGVNNVRLNFVPNSQASISIDCLKVYGVYKPNTDTINVSYPDQKTIYAGEKINLVELVGITPKNTTVIKENWQIFALDDTGTTDILEMIDASNGIVLGKKAGMARVVFTIQTLDSTEIITKSCVVTVLDKALKGIAIQKNGCEISMVDQISLTTGIDQRIMAVTDGSSSSNSGLGLATTDTQYIKLFIDSQEPAKAVLRICTSDFTDRQQVSVYVYALSNPQVKLKTLNITLLKQPVPANSIHFYKDDQKIQELTKTDTLDLIPGQSYKIFPLVTGADGALATDQELIWSSDKPTIVSVDQTGMIRAIGFDDTTAIITAVTNSGVIRNTIAIHVHPAMISGELSKALVSMGITEGTNPGDYGIGSLDVLKKVLDTQMSNKTALVTAWGACKKIRYYDQDTFLSLLYEAEDYYNSLPDSLKDTGKAGKTFYDNYISPYKGRNLSLDTPATLKTNAGNLITQITSIETNASNALNIIDYNKITAYYNQKYDLHMGNHVIEIDNVALQDAEQLGLTLWAFDQSIGADSITMTGDTYTLDRKVDGKILYTIEGIPNGIHVLANSIPAENKIIFKLFGSPLNPIVSDISMNITLGSAIMMDAWGNSPVKNSIKMVAILKAHDFLIVDATVIDGTVKMKSLYQPDEEDAVVVKINTQDATLVDRELAIGVDYTLKNPLPTGLRIKAKTIPTENTIRFIFSGRAINPITNDTVPNGINILGNVFKLSPEKGYLLTVVNGTFQITAFIDNGGRGGSPGGTGGSGLSSYIPTQTPTPTPTPKTFDDNDDIPNWAYSSVQKLVQLQVIEGMPNQSGGMVFKPDGYITRAQFAKLLVKALALTPGENIQSFVDVDDNAWYFNDVRTVASLGIANGFEDKFNPDVSITREEMVVMIVNAMKIVSPGEYQGIELQYDDTDTMSQWSKDSISIATKLALIKGSGNNFEPKELSNRAQAAVVIFRILEQLKKI